jgi:hypothetical protein
MNALFTAIRSLGRCENCKSIDARYVDISTTQRKETFLLT